MANRVSFFYRVGTMKPKKHQTLEPWVFSLLRALLGSLWGHLGMGPNLTHDLVDVGHGFFISNKFFLISSGFLRLYKTNSAVANNGANARFTYNCFGEKRILGSETRVLRVKMGPMNRQKTPFDLSEPFWAEYFWGPPPPVKNISKFIL